MKQNKFPFCTAKELMQKEVINKQDGKRLGYIKDLGLDIFQGQICSIILPQKEKGLFCGKEEGLVIPWNDIEKIGQDVILVRLPNCNTPFREKGEER